MNIILPRPGSCFLSHFFSEQNFVNQIFTAVFTFKSFSGGSTSHTFRTKPHETPSLPIKPVVPNSMVDIAPSQLAISDGFLTSLDGRCVASVNKAERMHDGYVHHFVVTINGHIYFFRAAISHRTCVCGVLCCVVFGVLCVCVSVCVCVYVCLFSICFIIFIIPDTHTTRIYTHNHS